MIFIEDYIRQMIEKLSDHFQTRLLYVGLQGSYLRGEATPDSDIDIMAVIDGLSVTDLDAYSTIVKSLPYADKACGFICSRVDLLNWNPLEICHLVNTTKDYYGELKELIPSYTELDVRNFVKVSINNLYHGICHRYIHGKADYTINDLAGTYKCVFFILQNLYYLQTGEFIATKHDLIPLLEGDSQRVLERSMELNKGICHAFDDSYELLFNWCQETLMELA